MDKMDKKIKYRVTGEVSVGRLKKLCENLQWKNANINEKNIDFVWETSSYQFRDIHRNAKVLNRISGLDPVQNKSSLAYLQQSILCILL